MPEVINHTEQSTAHLRYGIGFVLSQAREAIERGVDSETAIRNALSEQLDVVPPEMRLNLLVGLTVGAVAAVIHGPIEVSA